MLNSAVLLAALAALEPRVQDHSEQNYTTNRLGWRHSFIVAQDVTQKGKRLFWCQVFP
jgi:hypothetical protein